MQTNRDHIDPRLNLLMLGGAPCSILSLVQNVMSHMTRPEMASWIEPSKFEVKRWIECIGFEF